MVRGVIVASALLLALPAIAADSARPFVDGSTVWHLDGDATVDCRTWDGCWMKVMPTRYRETPPRTAHALALPPETVALPKELSWRFIGGGHRGYTDADVLVTMTDGTAILVSHTEDRTRDGVAPNNGLTIVVGSTRLPDVAHWGENVEQLVVLAFDEGSVRVGMRPAADPDPAVWSAPIPLPATAAEIRTLELRSISFGADAPGPVAYWFRDFHATADMVLSEVPSP